MTNEERQTRQPRGGSTTAPSNELKAIANRIKRFRLSTGMTQKELGDKIDAHQTSVSRWERGKEAPGGLALKRLATALGVSEREILGSNKPAGRRVRFAGELAAGDWRESLEDDSHTTVSGDNLPPHLDNVAVQAFRVRGDSMNKVYPDGSIVYVAPIHELPGAPKSGQMVAVQRRDSHGLYEATLKEYVIDNDGKKWLWPRSDSPLHQAPIDYKKNGRGEVEEVNIMGVVVAALVFPSL